MEYVYVAIYTLTGLIIGLSSHWIQGRLIILREEAFEEYLFTLNTLQIALFMILGILRLPLLIYYLYRLAQLSNRRRNSKEMLSLIQAMGLKKFNPIIITFMNGDSRYAGFDYVNKERACLGWFSPGTRMSGGGWDMTSHLTEIKKIERAKHHPGVIW